MKIKINERYSLAPLIFVEKDDLTPIFNYGRGVYICNFPEPDWYEAHNFKQTVNYSIEKKEKFFALMDDGAIILSPTQDSKIIKPTRTVQIGKVLHLGSRFTGRLAQIFMTIKLIKWLVNHRKSYDYCLCYNFYPGELAAAFVAKYFLRKRIVVDFEDDYLLQSKNKLYNQYFKFAKRIPNAVICINKNMLHYFPKQDVYVFNGFIDLSYVNTINFNLQDGVKLLYAGALDEIRGVDLIPDIIYMLRERLKSFQILITGSGSYEYMVKEWNFKEVTYLGFLSSVEYNSALANADVFLVLQKPEHPFSKGSFPSKIEFYSHYKKPIYKIELN
ncbi:MAG: hypothetical protein JJE55_12745 [Flavobacteriaceae bacterium]|nr:hypothetical protein [Flavobacteriaceae bacterium]